MSTPKSGSSELDASTSSAGTVSPGSSLKKRIIEKAGSRKVLTSAKGIVVALLRAKPGRFWVNSAKRVFGAIRSASAKALRRAASSREASALKARSSGRGG